MTCTPVIAGIGETPYSRPREQLLAKSEPLLACEAILGAAADAGLEHARIDGLVSFANSEVDPALLQLSLGLPYLRFSSMVWGGRGGGACGALALAAMAVASGQANCVAVVRSLSQSHTRRYGKFFPDRPQANFGAPFGLFSPAQMMALVLQRYLHQYGLANDAFMEVAISFRGNARSNPRALGYGASALSAQRYLDSRWIAEPLRLYDCCLESDGACAVIVTSLERARDLRAPPVRIVSAAQGSGAHWGMGPMGSHNMPDETYLSGNARELAAELFGRAGVTPADIDVAQIYDHFSGMVLIGLEDYGFCARGEAAAFVRSGALRTDGGVLPCNTSGGALGEAYVHGMNLVAEAVRQVRGEANLQVRDAQLSFVCSGGGVAPTSAAILGAA